MILHAGNESKDKESQFENCHTGIEQTKCLPSKLSNGKERINTVKALINDKLS